MTAHSDVIKLVIDGRQLAKQLAEPPNDGETFIPRHAPRSHTAHTIIDGSGSLLYELPWRRSPEACRQVGETIATFVAERLLIAFGIDPP